MKKKTKRRLAASKSSPAGTPKVGDSIKAIDLGECPFCDKGTLGLSVHPFAILHTLPICYPFAKDDNPVEFLKACIKQARTTYWGNQLS